MLKSHVCALSLDTSWRSNVDDHIVEQMAVDPVVQGVTAGLTGITAAVTILYTIERQGVRSAERMDAQLRTKLESKIDGGDAENKFSGTDQTLDDLIANMEAAQVHSRTHHTIFINSNGNDHNYDDDIANMEIVQGHYLAHITVCQRLESERECP